MPCFKRFSLAVLGRKKEASEKENGNNPFERWQWLG